MILKLLRSRKMSEFFNTVLFSFSVTGPIFIILLLGVWLKKIGIINDAFIEAGSKLTFSVTLPVLLFLSVSKASFSEATQGSLIAYGLLGTITIFLLLELLAAKVIQPPEDRGVFVQGAFRSNMGIIGLAYCVNAYGEQGLIGASLYLGFVTILFNILAVITLSRAKDGGSSLKGIFKGVFKNPLIIGILLGVPVSWLGLSLPDVVEQTGGYFANMALPLALLCTGGALNFRSISQNRATTLGASLGKLIFVPIVFTLGAVLLGFRDMELGILLLMSSAPTAAASYVMVRSLGGNSVIAANIIAITTLGSVLTTSAGVVFLKSAGWM